MEVRAYLPTVLIFDLQNLRKSGRPDFPEFQPVTILVFKIIFSMCLFSANREEIYFIDANRIQNQEYEYTHRCSERSICWNLCTDFINVDKFEAFSAILDKEKSKIFWGTMPLHPPRKRLCRGNSCLQRSLRPEWWKCLDFWFPNVGKYVRVPNSSMHDTSPTFITLN